MRIITYLAGLGGVGLLTILLPSDVFATVSAIIADNQTGLVGGAGNSCTVSRSYKIGMPLDQIIFRSVPARGAFVTQMVDLNDQAKSHLINRVQNADHPSDILNDLSHPLGGFSPRIRQLGFVNVFGQSDGGTGADVFGAFEGRASSALGAKKDVNGFNGRFAYAVQGNTLSSHSVVDFALRSLLAPSSTCNDLPERLLHAMRSAEAEGGDKDCIGGEVAFLKVQKPDGSMLIDLSYTCASKGQCENAHDKIESQFAQWRASHLCDSGEGTINLPATPTTTAPRRNYLDDAVLLGTTSAGITLRRGGTIYFKTVDHGFILPDRTPRRYTLVLTYHSPAGDISYSLGSKLSSKELTSLKISSARLRGKGSYTLTVSTEIRTSNGYQYIGTDTVPFDLR